MFAGVVANTNLRFGEEHVFQNLDKNGDDRVDVQELLRLSMFLAAPSKSPTAADLARTRPSVTFGRVQSYLGVSDGPGGPGNESSTAGGRAMLERFDPWLQNSGAESVFRPREIMSL